MSMRIGTVFNGRPAKMVRKNPDGTVLVQPVRKQVVNGMDALVNDGEQFVTKEWKRGRV